MTRKPGPARQLHLGGVHGRSDVSHEPLTAPVNVPPEPNYCIDLERHAEANATLAAMFRRVFIR